LDQRTVMSFLFLMPNVCEKLNSNLLLTRLMNNPIIKKQHPAKIISTIIKKVS
jgi:hypothetical protein